MYVPFDLATVVPGDNDQRGHDKEDRPLMLLLPFDAASSFGAASAFLFVKLVP
jgi:hypothetical protein